MTLITRDADASPDTSTLVACPPLGPLVAGEALDAIAPCYIKSSDGKVYMSNATGTGEASEVAGFTMKAYASGGAVTLYGVGARAKYGSSLTPGDILYVGATAGRLDDSATTGDQIGVAMCIDDEDIVITRAAVPQVTSPFKVGSAALADATGDGGMLAVANPEGATIILLDLVLNITTEATGAATANFGIAADGTTASDTVIDGLDVGAAAIVGNNQENAGTNGGTGRLWTASQFLTGTGLADPADLVGTAYFTYILA